jgi:filamentous hemagglutinin
LAPNFPVIDRFESGVATSIKSLDLGANSYQDLSRLNTKVEGYVNELAKWEGVEFGRVTIRRDQIRDRELLLAIPNVSTEAQRALLRSLQDWALSQGVRLTTQAFP